MKNPKLMSLVVATVLLLAAGMTFRDAKAPYLSSVETIAGTGINVENNSAAQKESCKPVQKQRKPRFRTLVAARPIAEWESVTEHEG